MKTQNGTAFYSALGNGKAAMVAFRDMVAHAVEHGDTSAIRFELERTRKDKRDIDALRTSLKIIRAVWPEGKFTITADKEVSIKTAGSTVSAAALETLNALVASEASFRGTKVKECFGAEKTTKAWDVAKWADNFAKVHTTQADFDKAIAALQARRPAAVQAVAA